MAQIGLVLIIIGWAVQLKEKTQSLSKLFLAYYIAGTSLLVLDGVTSLEGGRLYALSALNVIALLLCALNLKKFHRKK